MDNDLEFLEQELKMMLDNIQRVKYFVAGSENQEWKPATSLVVGELKHRAVIMRQRLTAISKLNTSKLFESSTTH